MQIAWLLDDGRMCVGVCENGGYLKMVSYLSPNAIKLSDKASAECLKTVLNNLGFEEISRRCNPVEHSWG
jgi:hypothetical protein